MAQKFIVLTNGQLAEREAATTSTGAADAGKIPALAGDGRLPESMMPVGIGADIKVAVASEDLSAGDLVNIYDNAGTATVRKADASNVRRAHGFVKDAVTSGANATVYLEGTITGKTGLTPGAAVYLGTTAGSLTATAPATAGQIVQEVGAAVSATEVTFEPQSPITLA